MSLINIIQDDFISLFDTATVVDAHANIVEYKITAPDNLVYTVYIDPTIHLVSITITTPSDSAINIILHNVTNIRCERKELTTEFYFYQGARPAPIAEFRVKPTIFIVADIQS